MNEQERFVTYRHWSYIVRHWEGGTEVWDGDECLFNLHEGEVSDEVIQLTLRAYEAGREMGKLSGRIALQFEMRQVLGIGG